MHSGDSIPRVTAHTSLADALVEMSRKGFGMTTVVEAEEIIGVFTDGDLRRCLDAGKDLHTTRVADVMSANFNTLPPAPSQQKLQISCKSLRSMFL